MIVHRPVLVEEVVRALGLPSGGTVLDATVGLGGHAEPLLKAVGPEGTLIAMDRDEQALQEAQVRLRGCADQIRWVHGNFAQLNEYLDAIGVEKLDAIVMDLGVSSLQLEAGERGFSFMREGPLDMRMDRRETLTAQTIVNRASVRELTSLLRTWGEEWNAPRIARAVVQARPIRTTTELAQTIRNAFPPRMRQGRLDPATRSFQAIRIAVNRELEGLERGLPQAWGRLRIGGRMAILAYHSLEDRIVKRWMKSKVQIGEMALITRKPLRPSRSEVLSNPRARSARLRVGERLA